MFPWSAVLEFSVLQLFHVFRLCIHWRWPAELKAVACVYMTLFSLEWGASPGLCCIIPTLRSLQIIKSTICLSPLAESLLILIRVSQGVSWPRCSNLTMLAGHISRRGLSDLTPIFPPPLSRNLELLPSVDETHFGPELEKIPHSQHMKLKPLSHFSHLFPLPPLPSHRREDEIRCSPCFYSPAPPMSMSGWSVAKHKWTGY